MYMYLSLVQLLCYCIGYTSNDDWSTSIIPLNQYQEKLQERRREWEASQPVQPEDRRGIDRLTRVLQERERELQEERREKEQVRTRLQKQLQGRERQLQQAQQQGQEREREIQQGREREQDLQRQLQEREQQLQREIQQAQQQGQERERQVQDLQRQLQEREQQLQEREQQLQREIQQAQQQGQERERQVQDLQRLLQEREQQLEEREREFQERERQREEQIQVAESSWVVNRREIIMTEVVLGKGGWGEVKVAGFRGLKVAAKCLYEIIISPHNIRKFSREMNIASKLRHPNLLQFIGATTEGNPIILTELMPTSLRKELETGGLAYPAILSISLDVACALNYLHLFKPHPILHRDVSSANVLLQGSGFGGWRAKVSDYGTVSLQPLARTCNPGNPVYSAPESPYPRQHSPSMDVFSYGVLLIEMVLCQFPEEDKSLREAQIKAIKRLALKNLIERCLIENYKQRPKMFDIIKEINESI